MKITIPILLAALFLCGCASQPKTPPVMERTRTYGADYDRTWGAMVAEFAGRYPFEILQKDSGLAQTKLLHIDTGIFAERSLSDYATKPSMLLPVWSDSAVSVYLFAAKKSASETAVTVRCNFQGFESNVTKAWIKWPSKGVLEDSILDRIGTRLNGGQ